MFDFSYQKFKKRRVCMRRTRRGSWKGIWRGWKDRPWNPREPFLFHCCLSFYRLQVVPHLSSGIVERAKRERAWKSPHAKRRHATSCLSRVGWFSRALAFCSLYILQFESHQGLNDFLRPTLVILDRFIFFLFLHVYLWSRWLDPA